MVFSMYMNKFLIFAGITALLAGCGGMNKSGHYNSIATSTPTDVQDSFLYSTSLYGSDDGGPNANIAVLLPMTGDAKSIGNDIKTSIETAFLRKPKSNIKISFYDLSGDDEYKYSVMRTALNSNPDVVIGPLFAGDAKIIRDIKPGNLPVLSFTSDTTSLGDGVMTMNLIPTQSIETIVRQMQYDGVTGLVLLAPNDNSGKTMVSVADSASEFYNIPIKGIFYYEPGKSDSIKDTAIKSSMFNTRNAVNIRAREILSDILTKENLTQQTANNLSAQLEKISRNETLGDLPYDAILFLGNGSDSKTLVSFLRYYGVSNRNVAFYGTTLWHDSNIISDFTMSGAKYATLPEISENFVRLYNMISDQDPNYLTSFGYDAANLALGMLFTQKTHDEYLYDPNGYVGTTGVFRIQPTGESERTLRIMELNGSATPRVFKESPENFLTPVYNVHVTKTTFLPEQELSTPGLNPGDYIKIPEYLKNKREYRTKTIGANYTPEEQAQVETSEAIQIYSDPEDSKVENPDFEPVKKETISRKYIDSVEVQD